MFDEFATYQALPPIDTDVWADRDLLDGLIEMSRVRAKMDADELAMVGAVDARQAYSLDGSVTTASWLAAHTQVSIGSARAKVKTARALRRLDRLRGAMDQGQVGFEQARVLTRYSNLRTDEAMARDEEMLVGFAKTLPTDDLAIVMRRWVMEVDSEGRDPGDREKKK